MEWLGGLIIVLGFVGLAKIFQLMEKNLEVIRISKSSISVMVDDSLEDLQKEKALQKNTKELLSLLFLIIATSLLAVGIPTGLVWLLDYFNLLSFNDVLNTIISLKFILVSVVISLIVILINRKKK